MTEESNITHLTDRLRARQEKSDPEQLLVERLAEAVDMKLAQHFQSQNQLLITSIGRLITELDGVRSGKAEHAFAKIAPPDCAAELPTVAVDSAIIFTHTAAEIGEMLGLNANQVGTLLGPRGLKWAGNPLYQEVDRYKPGRQRFWHRDVPHLLEQLLRSPSPNSVRGLDSRVKVIARKWRAKNGLAEVVPFAEN